MNIFVLSRDPWKAAKLHHYKHVVKMVLESAQLLAGAIHSSSTSHPADLYKPTHMNHPCAIWTRQSIGNYLGKKVAGARWTKCGVPSALAGAV